MRLQSSSSSSNFEMPACGDPNLAPTDALDLRAEVGGEVEHRLDVRDRRDVLSVTGSSVSRQAATIGRAAFLFPAARIDPESGRAPSMTKASIRASVTTVCCI